MKGDNKSIFISSPIYNHPEKKEIHNPFCTICINGIFVKNAKFPNRTNGIKKKINKRTHPRLARDDTLPNHQIHGPIWIGLRFSHKALTMNELNEGVDTQKVRKNVKGGYRRKEIESERTDMGVILTPGFMLLGKTATRNSSRHSLPPFLFCSATGMGFRP